MPAVEHMSRMRYASPEIIAQTGPLQNRQRRPDVSEAADIWAFGMVAYELLTQERVFTQASSESDVRKAAFRAPSAGGGYPWESDALSNSERNMQMKGMKQIVLQCLDRDPDNRPSAHDLTAHMESLLSMQA